MHYSNYFWQFLFKFTPLILLDWCEIRGGQYMSNLF
jgi:hypothetical protein